MWYVWPDGSRRTTPPPGQTPPPAVTRAATLDQLRNSGFQLLPINGATGGGVYYNPTTKEWATYNTRGQWNITASAPNTVPMIQGGSLFGDLKQNVGDLLTAAWQGWGPALSALAAGPAGLDVGAAAGGGVTGAAATGSTAGALNAAVGGGDIVKGAATGAVVGGTVGAVTGGAPASAETLDPSGLSAADTAALAPSAPAPAQLASADVPVTDVTAPTTGPFSSPLMPAAVPEPDPTFGGALTQTAPGVFSASPSAVSTPVSAPAKVEGSPIAEAPTAPSVDATPSGTTMPAAAPEPDPTFGGALTPSSGTPGLYESPISSGAVTPSTAAPDAGAPTTDVGAPNASGVTPAGAGEFGTDATVTPSGAGEFGTEPSGTTTQPTSQDLGTPGESPKGAAATEAAPTFDITTTPGADVFAAPSGGGTFGGGGGPGGLGSDIGGQNDYWSDIARGYESSQADQVSPDVSGASAWSNTNWSDIGNALTKYGPLALGTAGLANQINAGHKAADQLRQVGETQRQVGTDLINKWKSGEINAADAAAIKEWEQGAIAQVRQYYANAKQSDSSAAVDAEARVKARAEAMREAARQGLLKMGLDALNITDRYQAQAAAAEYNADQQLLANAMNFMNAYGAWLRGAPKGSSSRRSEDVASATGQVAGPDFSPTGADATDYTPTVPA